VDGFIVSEHRRKRAYRDDEVLALTHYYKIRSRFLTRHHVVLEVQGEGKSDRVLCSYLVPPGWPDPMAQLWYRISLALARRARTNLTRGGRLEGDGWHLDAEGLHHGGEVIPHNRLSHLTWYGRFVCVWKDADERPFLRVPRGSRNAAPL